MRLFPTASDVLADLGVCEVDLGDGSVAFSPSRTSETGSTEGEEPVRSGDHVAAASG